MIKILMQTGSLEWNLTDQVTHRAGDVLTITFRITNPTTFSRSYQIFMALFDPNTGAVIEGTSGPISIDGENTFEVAGEGELTLVAPLKINYSNVLASASLYDVQSGEMAIGLRTVIVAPPGIGEQIAPITGFATEVMALGLVATVVTGITADLGI